MKTNQIKNNPELMPIETISIQTNGKHYQYLQFPFLTCLENKIVPSLIHKDIRENGFSLSENEWIVLETYK